MTSETINSEAALQLQPWDYYEEYKPPFLFALILFPPVAPFFWRYKVGLNSKALSVGYSYYFQQEIDRSRVLHAEAIDHINGLTQWAGWGYRLNLHGEAGYITKNGSGVRLVFKNQDEQERTIVFNCEDPEKVCKFLNTRVLSAVT